MAHDHQHHVHPVPGGDHDHAFALGSAINLGFVVVEILFGLAANSMALLSDAGHNLGDVFGLLLAWGASRMARRPPSRRYTYGLRRGSILAALINACVLLVAVGGILWESVRRLAYPEAVAETMVIWVAAAGVVVNGASALLFISGHRHDINIRGAYLHLIADAAVSLGVVVTGVAIRYSGWEWLDPATGIVIAVVIAAGTWGLLRESFNLALDAVPAHVDIHAVEHYLAGLPGVKEVHDLHIWAMSTTEVALTAHLVRDRTEEGDSFLRRAGDHLREEFGIGHATLQIERGDEAVHCPLAPEHLV
ncbi:MAG: cation transporter [Proteobacteria bacterium]|nr:cation transporter [Pseudomonadota bacterium]HQR04314.1 cation diffusion facilitator family transporter [Rhodocyclaceae bacterium]